MGLISFRHERKKQEERLKEERTRFEAEREMRENARLSAVALSVDSIKAGVKARAGAKNGLIVIEDPKDFEEGAEEQGLADIRSEGSFDPETAVSKLISASDDEVSGNNTSDGEVSEDEVVDTYDKRPVAEIVAKMRKPELRRFAKERFDKTFPAEIDRVGEMREQIVKWENEAS
ncbi:hypothetical protein [uncultured Roseibium sp.]|uniref:hypothetical protein n=1 Tax=uncultured Roseibium sp. TaxID=1936171 RepID=UPI00261C43F7|nr:hypothetical protein [uncultured Roseibium sp.]